MSQSTSSDAHIENRSKINSNNDVHATMRQISGEKLLSDASFLACVEQRSSKNTIVIMYLISGRRASARC